MSSGQSSVCNDHKGLRIRSIGIKMQTCSRASGKGKHGGESTGSNTSFMTSATNAALCFGSVSWRLMASHLLMAFCGEHSLSARWIYRQQSCCGRVNTDGALPVSPPAAVSSWLFGLARLLSPPCDEIKTLSILMTIFRRQTRKPSIAQGSTSLCRVRLLALQHCYGSSSFPSVGHHALNQ